MLSRNYKYLQEFTNNLITILHRYATIRLYLAYFSLQYSDSLPMNTNSYSVTFGYTQYLVQHLMNDPEGKKTTIHHYLQRPIL
jgi:hypothetical protein